MNETKLKLDKNCDNSCVKEQLINNKEKGQNFHRSCILAWAVVI